MFPHEEHLLMAMKSTDFRMIGLVADLGRLYVSEMANRKAEERVAGDFQKALEIGKALERCSQEIARVQGDDPVSGGHAEDIVM